MTTGKRIAALALAIVTSGFIGQGVAMAAGGQPTSPPGRANSKGKNFENGSGGENANRSITTGRTNKISHGNKP